jgi:hypothetical protein
MRFGVGCEALWLVPFTRAPSASVDTERPEAAAAQRPDARHDPATLSAGVGQTGSAVRRTEDGMIDLLIPFMKAVAVLGIVYAALNIWELCRTGGCEMKDWL